MGVWWGVRTGYIVRVRGGGGRELEKDVEVKAKWMKSYAPLRDPPRLGS